MSNRRFSTITEPEADSLLQSRIQELQRLQEIESLTSKLTTLLQALYSQIELIKLGTESVANITSNWIQIVRAVSLAANSIMVYNNHDFKEGLPTTERLIRCALDDIGNIINDLNDGKIENKNSDNSNS